MCHSHFKTIINEMLFNQAKNVGKTQIQRLFSLCFRPHQMLTATTTTLFATAFTLAPPTFCFSVHERTNVLLFVLICTSFHFPSLLSKPYLRLRSRRQNYCHNRTSSSCCEAPKNPKFTQRNERRRAHYGWVATPFSPFFSQFLGGRETERGGGEGGDDTI